MEEDTVVDHLGTGCGSGDLSELETGHESDEVDEQTNTGHENDYVDEQPETSHENDSLNEEIERDEVNEQTKTVHENDEIGEKIEGHESDVLDEPEDPEFMERMERRMKTYDPMKAKYDRIREIRGRTVIVYPVKTSDLDEDWMMEAMKLAPQFFLRFFEYDSTKCENGSMELRLGSAREAKEFTTNLREKKPHLKIRHLDYTDVVDKVLMDMKDMKTISKFSSSKRMLVVEDLSSDINEDDLWGLFKEATHIFIPRDSSGISMGYGYVDYKTMEMCLDVDRHYLGEPAEINGKRLFIRPVWIGDGTPLEGMLDSEEREELRSKVHQLRKKRKTMPPEEREAMGEISSEISQIQRRLKRDAYLNKLNNKDDPKRKKPGQPKRRQQPRQYGNQKRTRQNWQDPVPAGNQHGSRGHGRGRGGYQMSGGSRGQHHWSSQGSGFPSHGRGRYGPPVQGDNEAVQNVLMGISQLLQGGNRGFQSAEYDSFQRYPASSSHRGRGGRARNRGQQYSRYNRY